MEDKDEEEREEEKKTKQKKTRRVGKSREDRKYI